MERTGFTRWMLLAACTLGACTSGQSGNEGGTRPDGGGPGPRDDAGRPPDDAGTGEVKYDRIDGFAGGVVYPTSLCQLVRNPLLGAKGYYKVEQLIGRSEENPANPGGFIGQTYVHLELIDGWHNTDGNVVARIMGGATPTGITGWDVSLKVGEVVGLFLTAPTDWNRGFPSLGPLGVFHGSQGPGRVYSNGQLVIDATAFGMLVEEIAASDPSGPCPVDVQPYADDSDAGADSR